MKEKPEINSSPKRNIDIESLRRGGLVKLKEKDMFSVWVRAVCCNMDARKLKIVADIAEKYGRGIILFSTRQFPIIPFVHFDNIEIVQQKLKEINLMLDRCGARVRNADVCYDSNICPFAVTNPITLAERFDEFWQQDIGGYKIKLSVVGCSKQCTSPRVLSDIGFVGVGDGIYDVYLGGRLGLKPSVGIKVAENLCEEKCVLIVKNFIKLIREKGKSGDRSADLVERLGEDFVKKELNKNLYEKFEYKKINCETKLDNKISSEKVIVRIKATCGEVTSKQLRVIAELAEQYGLGFVHFGLRGSPEIPGVDKKDLTKIKTELEKYNLELIENGIDNLQCCFGEYCTNGIIDAQGLLKKVNELIKRIKFNGKEIKISASGCPNSCAISHLSDIGFIGVIEPVVDIEKCTGCEICARACKVDAIDIVLNNNGEKKAKINFSKCKYCMDCINSCPFDAIVGGRRGISVLVGGEGGYSPFDIRGENTTLGKIVAEFLSEEETLKLTENLLIKSLKDIE
ncbi:MAG: 4Fe-4S dicluster domain-containing protein [Endomicrobiia bacterium]